MAQFNDTASIVPIAGFGNSGEIYFFPTGTLTSSFIDGNIEQAARSTGSFIISAITGSNKSALQFIIPSESAGQSTDIIGFHFTSSGKEPRIGFGTDDPQSSLDIRALSSSAPANIILRTNEDGEIVVGEETGRIIFAIESASFSGSNIITSGSVGDIFGVVTGNGSNGAFGKLVFSTNDTTGQNPKNILQLGYSAGGGTEFEVFISASDLIHDDANPQYVQRTNGDIISVLGFRSAGKENVGKLQIMSESVETIFLDGLKGDANLSGSITASIISASNKFVGAELSSQGDLTLDADGADVILKDGGTEFGRFKRDSSDFVIKSATNNKDIVFRGVDDTTTITALTLDMSDAGKAIFTGNVSASGTITANSFTGTVTTATTASYVASSNIDGVVDISSQTNLAAGANINLVGDTIRVSDDIAVNNITASVVSSSGNINATVGKLVYDNIGDVTTTNPYGEIIKYGTADSAVSAGSIYFLATDGKWKKTDADSEVSSSGLLGVAISTDAADGFLIRGMCDLVVSATTPTGSTLYLSNVDGRATATPTSGSGDVIRAVGYNLNGANQAYFNPDSTYIVAS